MPKIKMLKTERGADQHADGRSHGVKEYVKGESYEVSDALASAFESMKACERADKAEKAPKNKAAPGAPETK